MPLALFSNTIVFHQPIYNLLCEKAVLYLLLASQTSLFFKFLINCRSVFFFFNSMKKSTIRRQSNLSPPNMLTYLQLFPQTLLSHLLDEMNCSCLVGTFPFCTGLIFVAHSRTLPQGSSNSCFVNGLSSLGHCHHLKIV